MGASGIDSGIKEASQGRDERLIAVSLECDAGAGWAERVGASSVCVA